MLAPRLHHFLDERHVPYETLTHARTITAQETANAAQIGNRHFAKTVMVKVDGALAMVVMPLVGFDAYGQRLGMGGGWYDRTFAFRHERPAPPPYLVGAAFEVQRVDTLATAAWDVAADAICTESTFIDCRKIPA